MNPAYGACAILSALVLAGCIQVAVDEPTALVEPGPTGPRIELEFTWEPRVPRAGETVRFEPNIRTSEPGDEVIEILWQVEEQVTRVNHLEHVFSEDGEYEVVVQVRTQKAGLAQAGETIRVLAGAGAHDDGGDPGSEPAEPEPTPEEPSSDDAGGNRTQDPEGNATADPEPEPGEDGFHGFDGEPEDCLKLVPGPFDIGAEAVTGGYELRIVDVVLLVDETFKDHHGSAWPDVARAILARADEVYRAELDLGVELVALLELPESYFAAPGVTDSQVPLDASRAFMDDHHPDLDRDLVYTLVGADIAGTTAGRAECIGGAKYKDAAYGWGEADDVEDDDSWAGLPVGIRPFAVKVILHEMGHILGAHHHYANCVEHVPTTDTGDFMGACGMMFNDVGLVGFRFSALNTMAIRGWAEQVDL